MWRDRLRQTFLVYVATVIAVVSSLGAPLVPSIADGYDVSLGTAQWSLTVTLLVGALSAPVIGRLGDGPRRKGVLLAVLGTMTAGCLLAALPGPFAFLLVGRAAQGVGLSVLPLTMGLARDYVPPHALPRLLASLSVTASAGLGLGYPVSGLIAEHLSFHASFWFGVMFGVVAILGTLVLVPRRGAGESEPFDRIGSLTLLVGIASFTLALSQGEVWGWTSLVVLTLFVVSPIALLACVRHELRCAHPLVDLRSFRHRTVLTANVASLLLGLAMYMLLAMVARFVQTPTATGIRPRRVSHHHRPCPSSALGDGDRFRQGDSSARAPRRRDLGASRRRAYDWNRLDAFRRPARRTMGSSGRHGHHRHRARMVRRRFTADDREQRVRERDESGPGDAPAAACDRDGGGQRGERNDSHRVHARPVTATR
jgi:MFS family permease